MLKKDDHPGYVQDRGSRQDTIIDQIPDDFGKVVQPQQQQTPKSFSHFSSFSSSFSSSSIRHPDGSIEEKVVKKDGEGRETITVTKRNGDNCSTLTTITNPDGSQEVHESNVCPQMRDFKSAVDKMPNSDDLIDRMLKF